MQDRGSSLQSFRSFLKCILLPDFVICDQTFNIFGALRFLILRALKVFDRRIAIFLLQLFALLISLFFGWQLIQVFQFLLIQLSER
jgi:hypothetical protein